MNVILQCNIHVFSVKAMSMLAKLFMSGRSQAIRWPAKLRIDASEVVIEQVGDAYLIKPQMRSGQNLGAWLRAFYAATEPLPDAFLAKRDDQPPQERDWS
jgi:antitoxin VapB